MNFPKYTKNLKQEGNNIYSYNTHVATIEEGVLVRKGYWSRTTSKHINYVAKYYNLTLVDQKDNTLQRFFKQYPECIPC